MSSTKHYHMAIVVCKDGKRFANPDMIPENINVWDYLNSYNNGYKANGYEIECIQMCKSRKAAVERAEYWNDTFKENRTLMPYGDR